MPTRFQLAVPQPDLDDLQRRLGAFRTPPSPEDRGWEDGASLGYVGKLVSYWRDGYSWRAQEATLNGLSHFLAEIGETRLHFVHEKGRGPAPLPLVLAHGWPDSFLRFVKVIPLLTDPAAHGGDAADAFDVVIPSLPGFAFSTRGANGPTRASFGRILHALMTEELGYGRYGAHGGDIGGVVCDQLCTGFADAVVGAHFSGVPLGRMPPPADGMTNAEKAYLAQLQEFQKSGGGYMHLQGTKPWTPAVALNDSPAGLAAWIVEKMQAWSDCGGDIETRFTKDEILTNVMLYWNTQSIGTSFLSYRDSMKPGPEAPAPVTGRGAPAGFALFPKDITTPPRSWAERFYDVHRWTEMPAGGHFTAWEEPAALAEDICAFFRPLR